MTVFMTVMLCSYLLVFLIGVLTAWCCWNRPRSSAEILTRPRRSAVREILVVEADRNGRTPLTNDQTIAECCKKKHNVKSGRNQVSIFVTCLDSHHHATWLKAGAPTFSSFSDLRFMQQLWDAMQEQGQQSSASAAAAYAEYSGRQPRATTRVAAVAVDDDAAAAPGAAAKAAARPKRTARATAAPAAVVATAAAAAAADAETETLTATVTVTRPRPKRATRAVAPPMVTEAAAPEELPAVPDYFDDEDWWDEATPPGPTRPTIVQRAAATRRSPWTSKTEEGQ